MRISDILFTGEGTLHQAVKSTLAAANASSRLVAQGGFDPEDPRALRREAPVVKGDPFVTAEGFLLDLQGSHEICPLVLDASTDKFQMFFRGVYLDIGKKHLRALFESWCRLPGFFEQAGERTVQLPPKMSAGFTKDVLDQIGLHTLFENPGEGGLAWREKHENEPDESDLIVVANGVIDTRDGTLLNPTPRLYATSASGVEFDPDAGEPVKTMEFLNRIFGGDREQIDTYFEFMGEVLAGTNDTQKALLLKGPTRSGKSTCVKVIKALLPKGKSASKRVRQLGQNFGQQSLVGKQLCVFEDVRSVNPGGMECLLSLIAGDEASVEIKRKDDFVGQLHLKCILATNVRINASTSADAFRARLVMLKTVESFKKREDTSLLGKLLEERTEILSKAVQGYRRLKDRGNYLQPKKSDGILDEVCEDRSEMDEFIADCIEVGPDFLEDRTLINEVYRSWSRTEGHTPRKAGDVWAALLDRCENCQYLDQQRVHDPLDPDLRPRLYAGLRLKGDALRRLEPHRWHRFSHTEGRALRYARTRLEIEVAANG